MCAAKAAFRGAPPPPPLTPRVGEVTSPTNCLAGANLATVEGHPCPDLQDVGAPAPPAFTQTISPTSERSTPPPDVIPHPALDVHVDAAEPERSGLDKVVF